MITVTTIGASMALFAAALTQEAYCEPDGCVESIVVVLIGGFGALGGGAALCWFANPLLLGAWVFWLVLPNKRVSLLLCVASTAVAASFLLFDEVIVNEAGHYREIVGYAPGYWLWVASHAAMLVGNLVFLSRSGERDAAPRV